jgi:O-antigen ligase
VILLPTSAPSASPSRRLKAVAIFGGAIYIVIAFLAVMKVQSALVPSYTVVAALAALPICTFLAFRYPLVFPFSLYVVLVPFDSLLQVSSGATIARLIALATAGALGLHAIVVKRAFVPHRSWFVWLGLVLYLVTSLLWTSDPKGGIEITGAVVPLFLFMTVLALYPASKTEFRIALGSFVLSGILSATYALRLYETGDVSKEAASRVVLASGNGIVLDFNYFGASFIVPIAVALFFAFYGKKTAVRLASAASALLMLGGILVTGSRGAFVAAVLTVAYFAFRSRYRAQVLGFMAFAAAASLFFPSVYERFASDPSGHQGSASGRTFIWETALHSIGDHWLFGNGVGSFQNTYDRNFLDVFQAGFQGWSRPSHNLLVGALTELGVVGLIVVVAAWYVSFRQLRVIAKTSEWYGVRVGLEGAILGLFAMSLTIDPTYIKYVWLAHSLVLMLLNQVDPRYIRLTKRARQQPNVAWLRGRPARVE